MLGGAGLRFRATRWRPQIGFHCHLAATQRSALIPGLLRLVLAALLEGAKDITAATMVIATVTTAVYAALYRLKSF